MTTTIKCTNCQVEVRANLSRCHVCQSDIGFPNVRAASTEAEQIALAKRLADAKMSAQKRHCENVLAEFGKAVTNSHAIMSRSLGDIKRLVDSENALFNTFYGQVYSGSRMPEDNVFDRGRESIDGILFPYYKEHILFAALSLNERGIGGNYGKSSIILDDKAIANRATVFEENSFYFCTVKHRIIIGGQIPPGYRAQWKDRDRLAMSKHVADLTSATAEADFPEILLHQSVNPEDEIFMEVHIYGEIHGQAIKAIILENKPSSGPDLPLWNSLKRTAKNKGILIKELP